MAAFAALVCLTRVIDQILPHHQDYAFLCDKEQMESLRQKAICLQDFLESISLKLDALLESRIRDVAHQLEDIIESIICNFHDQGFAFRRVAKNFSRRLGSNIGCLGGSKGVATSCSSPTMNQLSAVFITCIEEIDILLEEATKTKNIPLSKCVSEALDSSTTASSSRGPPSNAKDTEVGLDKDLTLILGRITGHGSERQIVPITGMGGIGKTTLAKAVYEHSSMLHHFDVRLWVTISQEYDIQEVLGGLLHSGNKTVKSDRNLIEQVHQYLKGRRYLIVLDDMWHEKAWDGVMNALPDDNNSSRIILTTRQLGVATYVGSLSHVHQMQLLNNNQSWTMLKQKVFGQDICPKELENIGRTISENCKGLPLAVVVIAGLLKCNKTEGYWEVVAKNTKAAAATEYDYLFGILSFSYNGLPPQLKACFLYMGSFPEDYEIRTKDLAMLWTAEGFLKPRESRTMEEVVVECLEELAQRSLALVRTRRYDGKIKTCIIHDVLREVSIRKAREEKFLLHHNAFAIKKSMKHQLFRVSFYKNDLLNFQHDTPVHSFQYTYPLRSQWLAIRVFKSLGVLIRNNSMLTDVCEFTRLRYLRLRYHPHSSPRNHLLISVPNSIFNLRNLETFICYSTSKAYYSYTNLIIPLEIWKLPRLRHLVLLCDNNLQFPEASQGYPVLESLQTLSSLKNTNITRSVIEKIPNINKLKLEYIVKEQVFSVNNLQHLHQLEELSIYCPLYDDILIPATGFGFPQNLKELSLEGTQIPVENMSLIGLLPNLEVLKLKNYSISVTRNPEGERVWEPIEGEFLKLKNLTMKWLDIEEWRAESIHFPSLEELIIEFCSNLKEVPESIGEIDTLQKLIVKYCRKAENRCLKYKRTNRNGVMIFFKFHYLIFMTTKLKEKAAENKGKWVGDDDDDDDDDDDESLQKSITVYTGLTSSAFFTVVALGPALYYMLSNLFGSSDDSNSNHVRSRGFAEKMEPLPPPVQVGEISDDELKLYDGTDAEKPLLYGY